MNIMPPQKKPQIMRTTFYQYSILQVLNNPLMTRLRTNSLKDNERVSAVL